MNNLEENQPFFEGSIVIRFWELATALFLYPSFIIVNLLRWCVPKSLKKLNTTGLLVIFDLLVIIIIFFTPLSTAARVFSSTDFKSFSSEQESIIIDGSEYAPQFLLGMCLLALPFYFCVLHLFYELCFYMFMKKTQHNWTTCHL